MFRNFNKILIAGLLLATLQGSVASGQTDSQLTTDDVVVLKMAEAIVQLGRQYQDLIWPGYDLSKMLLILYIPDRWAMLLNAPRNAEGFSECPAGWPDLKTHVLYHAGQYDGLVGQLAFDIEIDSNGVAAVAFDEQSPRRFLEYAVHENFHQYQYATFGEIPWEREELYPIEDATNTALACLEIHCLRDAVRYAAQGRQDLMQNRVTAFVALRNYRWRVSDPYVRNYEQGQEINEGTAKYVEIKASSLVPKLHYTSALGKTSDTLFAEFAKTGMPETIIDGLNHLIDGGTVAPEDMLRNRIYPVGAAEGYLLDQFGMTWKPSAQQAGPDFTFAAMLESALNLDSTQETREIPKAKELYDYDSIIRKTREIITAYSAGYDSAVAVFESEPGIRVEMSFSGKGLMRSRSSSAKKWLVENGSKEYRDHYNVYVLKSWPDEDFSLQLKDAGLLEMTDWSPKDKTVVFFCPEIESLTIDGVTKNPRDQTEYHFDKLSLTGTDFELKSDQPGTISIANKFVSINLES